MPTESRTAASLSLTALILSVVLLAGCREEFVDDPNAQLTLSEISPTVEGRFGWGLNPAFPGEFRVQFFGRVTVGRSNGPVAFDQLLTEAETADLATGMVVVPTTPATVGYVSGGSSYRLRQIESLVITSLTTLGVEITGTLGPARESNPAPGPSSVTMVLTSAAKPICQLDDGTGADPATASGWTTPNCADAEIAFSLTPLLDSAFGR